ncbi:MAG: squalene/phytoene synthase family protein, partial [Gammaproteobacteria bacterium]|nr:squalene/phytoene synthase family protein [Gammaproteobacteria bacterium]
MNDLEYQQHILQDVSRTFALTIPQLPPELDVVVGNAYLLCRIADTIEDESALSPEMKRRFSEDFVKVLGGALPAEDFALQLLPQLSGSTLAPERDLVLNTPRVVRITRGFSERKRAALERCVRIMSRGMSEFQQNATLDGLEDLPHLDRYCYHVAGVVGEMLTELFCDYSPEIDRKRETLYPLAVSFGQGLQMTNILKDVWEDRHRGACWLPRQVFREAGFDLRDLKP